MVGRTCLIRQQDQRLFSQRMVMPADRKVDHRHQKIASRLLLFNCIGNFSDITYDLDHVQSTLLSGRLKSQSRAE